jgi:hypothetical protein
MLPEIEIGYSSSRLLRLLGLGILMTSVCAALAFNWYHDANIGLFPRSVGYVGVVFFGFATCKIFWLLTSSRSPVVFIRRDGIRDTRISDDIIEWRSVDKISIAQPFRQKFVVLELIPVVAERLRLAGGIFRRTSSFANKALGVDGAIINPAGLTMDPDTLFDTCMRYRAAAGQDI